MPCDRRVAAKGQKMGQGGRHSWQERPWDDDDDDADDDDGGGGGGAGAG